MMSQWVFLVVCATFTSINIATSQSIIQLPAMGSDDVVISCGDQEMSVTVSSSYIEQSSNWLDSKDRLCLGDRKCKGTVADDGSVVISVKDNFLQCGNVVSFVQTVNGSSGTLGSSFYQFSNRLMYDGSTAAIIRDVNLMRFKCLYPATQIALNKPSDEYQRVLQITDITGDIEVINQVEIVEGGQVIDEDGDVVIEITLEAPQIPANVEVTSFDFSAQVTSCWLQNDETRFDFLQNGCPTVDESVFSFLASEEPLTSMFRLQASYFGRADDSSVHCIVGVCDINSGSCAPTCTNKRKRRSADMSSINPRDGDKETNFTKYSIEVEKREFVVVLQQSDKTEVFNGRNSSERENQLLEREETAMEENNTLLIALIVSIAAVFVIIAVLVVIVCKQMKKSTHRSSTTTCGC